MLFTISKNFVVLFLCKCAYSIFPISLKSAVTGPGFDLREGVDFVNGEGGGGGRNY